MGLARGPIGTLDIAFVAVGPLAACVRRSLDITGVREHGRRASAAMALSPATIHDAGVRRELQVRRRACHRTGRRAARSSRRVLTRVGPHGVGVAAILRAVLLRAENRAARTGDADRRGLRSRDRWLNRASAAAVLPPSRDNSRKRFVEPDDKPRQGRRVAERDAGPRARACVARRRRPRRSRLRSREWAHSSRCCPRPKPARHRRSVRRAAA